MLQLSSNVIVKTYPPGNTYNSLNTQLVSKILNDDHKHTIYIIVYQHNNTINIQTIITIIIQIIIQIAIIIMIASWP